MLSVGAIHPPFTVGVPVVGTVTVGAFGVFCGLVVGGATSVCCVVAFAAEKAVAAYPPPTTSKTISAANTNDLLARGFLVARPPPQAIPAFQGIFAPGAGAGHLRCFRNC